MRIDRDGYGDGRGDDYYGGDGDGDSYGGSGDGYNYGYGDGDGYYSDGDGYGDGSDTPHTLYLLHPFAPLADFDAWMLHLQVEGRVRR